LKTRYYDPEVGRFIHADDVSYLGPDTINGLNLYAYCGNNPVMLTDSTGTMPDWLKWALGITIIVGAVALSILTAGLAAPIAASVGGGLFGAIVGGAVAGAIGGAIAGFGISIGMQGINKGFDNIDWHEVGKATLSGAISGFIKYERKPFSFFSDNDNLEENLVGGNFNYNIIYSYFALYGDSLKSDDVESYPDFLLERYAKLGINGIWMQGLLYQLSDYPFDRRLSEGYQERRKNLNKLIERCKKYGIKVYLYINEPRAMAENFFAGREYLKGAHHDGLYSLCTSQVEVKDYLYNSVKDLFSACPDLGGIIAITMSENLTRCYSKSYDGQCNCQVCKDRSAEEIASEINNIFARAFKDSGSNGRIIANLWGWDPFMK